MQFTPLGDSAVVIGVGKGIKPATLQRVRALTAMLRNDPPHGTMDIVPAYTTITVFYDLARISSVEDFSAELKRKTRWVKSAKLEKPRTVTIPVCYGGEFGPELPAIAQRTKLSEKEVISMHLGGDYVVHALGFAPGFTYLGGLAEKLHTPRLETPRTHVPPGSVGIGGVHTGVYPFSTPAGWNLIGRTPISMFRMREDEPALLRMGDQVKFRSISEEEFTTWK